MGAGQPPQGSFPLSVLGIPSTGMIPTWKAGGFVEWTAPSASGAVSLTGPGETATPGDLTQAGGFTVNVPPADMMGVFIEDQGSTAGIQVIQNGAAGIALADNGAGGISMTASGTGPCTVEQDGTGDLNIENTTAGNLNIFTSGGILHIRAGGGTFHLADPTDALGFFGTTPVVRPAAIPPAAGGAVIDIQARAAVNAVIAALGSGVGGLGLTD